MDPSGRTPAGAQEIPPTTGTSKRPRLPDLETNKRWGLTRRLLETGDVSPEKSTSLLYLRARYDQGGVHSPPRNESHGTRGIYILPRSLSWAGTSDSVSSRGVTTGHEGSLYEVEGRHFAPWAVVVPARISRDVIWVAFRGYGQGGPVQTRRL